MLRIEDNRSELLAEGKHEAEILAVSLTENDKELRVNYTLAVAGRDPFQHSLRFDSNATPEDLYYRRSELVAAGWNEAGGDISTVTSDSPGKKVSLWVKHRKTKRTDRNTKEEFETYFASINFMADQQAAPASVSRINQLNRMLAAAPKKRPERMPGVALPAVQQRPTAAAAKPRKAAPPPQQAAGDEEEDYLA